MSVFVGPGHPSLYVKDVDFHSSSKYSPIKEIGALPKRKRVWSIVIRNTGTSIAEKCNAQLLELEYETRTNYSLDSWPTNEYLAWSNDNSEIDVRSSDKLQVYIDDNVYFFAYANGKQFREENGIPNILDNILILIDISSYGKLPIYAVLRLNMKAKNNENLLEIIDRCDERPNLKTYQKQESDKSNVQNQST